MRFALLVNETPVGDYVADQRRGDLVRAKVGSGNHAFRIPIDPDWLSSGDNTLTIRTRPDNQRLADALVIPAAAHNAALGNNAGSRTKPGRLPASAGAVPAADAALTSRDILRIMRDWKTKQLVGFQTMLESELMLDRAKTLFRDKNWAEIADFFPTSVPERKGRTELNTLVGRGLLYDGAHAKAAQILKRTADFSTAKASTHFYASIASARAGKYEDAIPLGRAALRLDPDNKQYLIDHGTHCFRLGMRTDADANLRRSLLIESMETLQRAIAIDERRHDYCLFNVARCQVALDRFADGVTTIERLLVLKPDHVEGLILLSQALVGLNRIKEALEIAERVVELDPLRQGPRFQLRSLRALVEDGEIRPVRFGVARWNTADRTVLVEAIGDGGEQPASPATMLEFSTNPAMALASLGFDWLLLTDVDAAPLNSVTVGQLLAGANSWAGRIVGGSRIGAESIWRRDLLVGLAESGVIDSVATLPASLALIADQVATVDVSVQKPTAIDLLALATAEDSGTVVVMSRHGIVKFGGGEQFLDSMAEHYEQMGFSPIIVGTRPERVGEEGTENGRDFAFVDMSPAALRAYFLRVRPRFVHVLSGLGFQVAEALEYLDIPFVYGVHFWRDCLGLTDDDTRYFLAHDREPVAKPAFAYVIEKASTVYSNSEYTRAILDESFAIRTPVIYSLPRDVDDQRPGTPEEADAILAGWRDYILLVNAKTDKGFDLIVQTAKRVPQARFVVIASQSDRREAEATIEGAGISNLHIIDHTARMDIVYSRARAVAVPSYMFVETFSRVCIEGQRYGKPVLGSTIGNVPYLLRESGVILPDDADAWAQAIARIYADEDHYTRLCAAAVANAERYGYPTQRDAVDGMISTLPAKVLIGVGSGIGNMLHVSPMIRNISRRIGRKVDLVMTEDHQNSLFLLQNDQYVNSVYALRQLVLRKKYDAVFISHCFGNARLPFQSQDILYSRDWLNFEAGGQYHETIYNLEAAKAMLGIPYDEADIADGYYVGNFRYAPPGGRPRIGIHGGSKDGFWRSKRWPGHAALAERLQAMGYEVASFGIEEEYVPGTIDMTGGTIAEMVEKMLGLSYFISNDSGVMNIANALGLPVMGLFGPTNPLTRGPISANGRWLSITKDCAPCEVTKIGRATFQSGNCQCIADLPLETVETGVLDHMRSLGLA